MPLPHAAKSFADIFNSWYSYIFSLNFGQNFPCLPEILQEFIYVQQVERSYQNIIKNSQRD